MSIDTGEQEQKYLVWMFLREIFRQLIIPRATSKTTLEACFKAELRPVNAQHRPGNEGIDALYLVCLQGNS